MIRVRAAVCAALAGLLGPLLALPATPAAAVSEWTALALETDRQWRTFTPFDSQFRVSAVGPWMHFDAQRPDTAPAHVAVAPRAGTTFTVGTYPVASEPTASAAAVFCPGATSGTMHVTSVTKAAAGNVTKLALWYDVVCDGHHTIGHLRFHSTTPWFGVDVPWPDFGTGFPGQPVTRDVTVTGKGPTGTVLGTAALAGADAGDFAITNDGCNGATLAVNASCVVTVAFTPPMTKPDHLATLSIPANAPRNVIEVDLRAAEYLPPPAPAGRIVTGDDGNLLTWTAPPWTASLPPVTGYRVYRDGDPTPVGETTALSYVAAEPAGSTHTYTLTTVGQGTGEGPHGPGLTATVPATAPDPGPVNVVGLDGSYDDWTATAVIGSAAAPGVVTFTGGGRTVTIRPDTGTVWQPGTVGAEVSVSGLCFGHATLTVAEARVHADGTPVVLAAGGPVACGPAAALYIRYAASTGLVRGAPSTAFHPFGYVLPGQSSDPFTATITNAGSDPLVLGTAAAPAQFGLSADGCSGRSVAAGSSCTVDVTFAPAAGGVFDGMVTIPDNSPRGNVRFRIQGLGGGKPTVPRDVVATALVGRTVLTWTAPETAVPALQQYLVERETATGWVYLGSTGAPRYEDRYGTAGEHVRYRVYARNSVGDSPRVEVGTVVPERELYVTAAQDGSPTYHLHAVTLPGGTVTRHGDYPTDEEDPAVSPDGTRLAYTYTDANGRTHLQTRELNGDGWSHVGTGNGTVDYRDPAWSPDGTRLAYACRPVAQDWWDVCVDPYSSGSSHKVKNGTGAASPAWLTNSELLVVDQASPRRVQVLAVDGSFRVDVPGTDNARHVAVSPDGGRFAWTRFEGNDVEPGTGSTPRYSLRVSPLATGGAGLALTDTGYSNDPAFAPDGATVYYTHSERLPAGALGNRDVFAVPTAGGAPVRVTDTPALDEDDVTVHDPLTPPAPDLTVLRVQRPLADFTGDGRADIAIWRPVTGTWRVRGLPAVQYGRLGDVPVAADWTGDRKADYAVFRPETSTWYVRGRAAVTFGQPGDIPVPADWTGDGKADIAVFRPSDGGWYIRGHTTIFFGRRGDIPVVADYTGDHKADPAVVRPNTGQWWVRGLPVKTWSGTFDVPGDYIGDARADYGVYKPGTGGAKGWFVLGAQPTYQIATVSPLANDLPAYGNLNGDAKLEPGVFNPTLGLWRILGQPNVVWGTVGDVPV